MGPHGTGGGGSPRPGAANAAPCPGPKALGPLWKLSWQMLATAGVWAGRGGSGAHEPLVAQNPLSPGEVLGPFSGHSPVPPTRPRDPATAWGVVGDEVRGGGSRWNTPTGLCPAAG